MPEGLDKLAGGIGKAVETVPDLYDDALKPITQESGKTLALIPRAINAALSPLRQWIAQREYNVAETEKLLAQKLENIDPEKIVSPEAYVAVPALQAISYSMNSDELRELYANLLAKSMCTDTKNSVHPSFVEIIKQMSPLDAVVFKIVLNANLRPLIDMKIGYSQDEGGGSKIVFRNVSWITNYPYKQLIVSFDNLERLNLIDISDSFYTHSEHYQLITNTSFYNDNKHLIENSLDPKQSYREDQKIMQLTDLGILFGNICI
jgi:hypothetical protein